MARFSYSDDFLRALAVAEARATERRRRIALGVIGVVVLIMLGAWVLHRNRGGQPVDPTSVLPRYGQVEPHRPRVAPPQTRGRAAGIVQPTGQPSRGVLLARRQA